MTAAIGHTSVLLALLLAFCGIATPILAHRTGKESFFAAARAAILGQFALVTLASLALIYGLVMTDFSIQYVANNTTRATPIYYRVTGLWGALEGSLMLWEWILIIFSGLVAWIYKDRHRELMPWVLMIFVGYLMLRSLIEDEERAAVSGAIVGIIGFLDIPLIHMSVYWWRTLHQPPSILRPDKAPWENIHPAMLIALSINFIAFLLLYFYLLSLRIRVGETEERIKRTTLEGTA